MSKILRPGHYNDGASNESGVEVDAFFAYLRRYTDNMITIRVI
jgi:hypothetical protein